MTDTERFPTHRPGKTKALSWKARRAGTKFCAPACGRGCTVAQHETALRNGKALASSLGTDWKARVWENLGWHYSAVSACGRLKVHPGTNGYIAFIGADDSAGGRWAERGSTPSAAVSNVVRRAKQERAWIDGLLRDLPRVR